MKKRTLEARKRTGFLLWLAFALLLGITCVLSFQSGSVTKGLDRPIVEQLNGAGNGMSQERIQAVLFVIRQTGRAVLFALLGLTGGGAALLSLEGFSVRGRLMWMGTALLAVSYLTEKLKIFIEGRHYSFWEFVESLLCAMAGLLCAWLVYWLAERKRRTE